MTNLDRKLRQAMRQETKGHHVKALIAGLDGNPQLWDYTGLCIDSGKGLSLVRCVCGHPIRFQFMVCNHETNEIKALGSVCIEHYREYHSEDAKRMDFDLERMKQVASKAARKAKEAAKMEEVRIAAKNHASHWDEGKRIYDMFQKVGQRPPRYLWEMFGSWSNRLRMPQECPKSYARAASYLKWYERETPRLIEVVNSIDKDTLDALTESIENRRQEVEERQAEIGYIIEVFKEQALSEFCQSMLKKFEQQDLKDMSERQQEVIGQIYAKSFGRKNSRKYNIAVDYYQAWLDGKLDSVDLSKPVKVTKSETKTVSISEEGKSDDLPF